jgi:hypothetical protein
MSEQVDDRMPRARLERLLLLRAVCWSWRPHATGERCAFRSRRVVIISSNLKPNLSAAAKSEFASIRHDRRGGEFYRHAVNILLNAEHAEFAMHQRLAEPSGVVRFTSGVATAQFAMRDMIIDFVTKYRRLSGSARDRSADRHRWRKFRCCDTGTLGPAAGSDPRSTHACAVAVVRLRGCTISRKKRRSRDAGASGKASFSIHDPRKCAADIALAKSELQHSRRGRPTAKAAAPQRQYGLAKAS